jgi:hypothetical protein
MLRGSDESQARTLALIGTAVLLCAVLAVLAVVVNPFGGRPPDRISVAIDTPYVGQGVESGTALILHGVEVGKVTDVSLSPGGGVRLATELQKRPAAGLTETMNIDFRPINYFGIPGVNIIPTPGGRAVRDGSEIHLVPKGNFTLSELLSQLGDVSALALTPRLINVVDRVTRYVDGLNPLAETMLTITKTVANVQRVSTAQLLGNTATISAAFPPFVNAGILAPARLADFNYYPEHTSATPPPGTTGVKLTVPFLEYTTVKNSAYETEDYINNSLRRFYEIASGGLFAAVGKLAGSHVDDLLPLIDGIKGLSDTAPSLLRPKDIAQTLAEVRSRFEKLYAGNGEQRALRVRILLDSLPGVAAPLGVVTGSPPDGMQRAPEGNDRIPGQ